MKTGLYFGILFSGVLALTAAGQEAADQAKLVAANTGFAFDLMGRLAAAKPAANIFISPYSVSSALQMVENGAAGGTRAEMQRVLKTEGMSAESVDAAFGDLDQTLHNRKDATLEVANGMWYQKGFHIKSAFTAANQKYFRAGLDAVDFGAPQSAATINDWADRQTHGKIKEVVQYPFPPLTRLILADAIYFKGRWIEPFKKTLTVPRDFHLSDGTSKKTPMMTRSGDFIYKETADYQAAKLPYQGGLQMELYLPKTNSSPEKLLSMLSAPAAMKSGFARSEGTVTLPKFKIDYSVTLNDPLEALGMKSAFTGRADFSGIADEPLFISEVRQKSYVDVNEEGTEAAAVTTVGVASLAMRMPPPNRFTMILDHPFFFVISDAHSGSILFMGIINDPVND